jgi:hypothetical protein
VKFTRTVRVVRRAISPAFPPEPPEKARAAIMADITSKRNLNPGRRHRTYPAWSSAPGTLLPRQETCRQGHPPQQAADDHTGQPARTRHGSLINIG